MNFIYNIVIQLLRSLGYSASLFSSRARLWVKGQKRWKALLSEKISAGDRVIWFHCSSLGEFEQGRPVIEEIKKLHPQIKILLTFFSPSGYEIRKNYGMADCVCYLPADTASNARVFLELAHPDLAIFVKYEFWNNLIMGLHKRGTPTYLISAIFRPDQHFFRWYGGFFRAILKRFDRIFVQDGRSVDLLASIDIDPIRAGDTRFDRVVQIPGTAKEIPQILSFRGDERLFLAGSSWGPDEEIIARYINMYPGNMKWVFAPHEINEAGISALEKMLRVKSVRFSRYDESSSDSRVMIIDNIGMLSSAYRYASIAAVGGGFGKGIHNILEPACWGIPVLFGPRHEKFQEAIELLTSGGGFTFNSFNGFHDMINRLLSDQAFYLKSASAASSYVNNNTGATNKILNEVMHNI